MRIVSGWLFTSAGVLLLSTISTEYYQSKPREMVLNRDDFISLLLFSDSRFLSLRYFVN
jgi:hypothetical protein